MSLLGNPPLLTETLGLYGSGSESEQASVFAALQGQQGFTPGEHIAAETLGLAVRGSMGNEERIGERGDELVPCPRAAGGSASQLRLKGREQQQAALREGDFPVGR